MSKNTKFLDQLKALLAREFTARLVVSTAAVSTALFEASASTTDADVKSAILGARDVWESHSLDWEAATLDDYVKRFDEKLADDQAAMSKTTVFSLDSLSLVEDDAMREEILLGNVTKRLTDACDYELFALSKRVEALADGDTLAEQQNPVVPRVFCRALIAGLTTAGANVSQRCEILSAAQTTLATVLTATLKEGNELLVSHGFMIEIPARYGKPINRSTSGVPRNQQVGGGSTTNSSGSSGDNTAGAGGDLSDLFARLLSQAPGGSGSPATGAAGNPVDGSYSNMLAGLLDRAGGATPRASGNTGGGMVTAAGAGTATGKAVVLDQKLIDVLERFAASSMSAGPIVNIGGGSTAAASVVAGMAADAVAAASPGAWNIDAGFGTIATLAHQPSDMVPAPQVHPNLVRQAQPMLAAQMQPVQNVITDVVAGFFDRIFEATDIPDSIKALVGRLQIQILRASMQDPRIFTNAEHPLRRFIDQLADIGVKRQQSLVQGDPVFEQIAGIVQKLHLNIDRDPKAVETAEAELAVFIQAEEESAQGVIFDSVIKVQQAEEIEMGVSMATYEIERRLAGKAFPETISNFARSHWQQVLAKDYLADGEDGTQWKSDIASLDDLLWSIEPHASKQDRPRLLKLLPTLLGRLNAGLDRIGVSSATREPYFQTMVELHTNVMRPTKSAAPPEEQVNDQPIEGGMMPADPRARLRKRSIDIERGQWIEMADDDGVIQHCRLSWVSPLKETFIFKNYDTKLAITLTSEEFRWLQSKGRIKLLEEHSITERSIEGAIRGLLQQPAETPAIGLE